ncbi:MAG: Bax inhibitor-1 family protein [Flavobacteriia bacterium]|jgi:FtsH-binding integral membrane protein
MLDNIFQQKKYDENAKTMTSEFFVNVYTYMFIALGISGSIAFYIGAGEQIQLGDTTVPKLFAELFFTETGISPLFYVVAFAPVGLGLLIQMAYNRLSMSLLLILFALYSGLMGLSLSSIFVIYSLGSIASTFLVTAVSFGAMAILGYTTKTDLTKFGSLLYMVFIGMFVAGLINFFMGSEMVSYIISILGVFVFTGLTAYQMQQLKHIGEDPNLGQLDKRKLSLIGGLMLYILFINLFLSLLRLMGNRD